MPPLTRRSFLKSVGIGIVGALTGIRSSAQLAGNVKTVYFYKDIHSGGNDDALSQPASEDLARIIEFCKLHQIDTICIEGWAGNAVDEKRGFVLLNGERQLIQALWKTNYKIIPLENEQLQYNALRSLLLRQIVFYRAFIAHCFAYASQRDGFNKEEYEQILASRRASGMFKITLSNIDMIGKQLNLPVDVEPFDAYVDATYSVLSFARATYQTYNTQVRPWEEFELEFDQAYKKYRKEIHIEARNEFAVSVVERLSAERVVVVFGSLHFEQMAALFKQKGIECIDLAAAK